MSSAQATYFDRDGKLIGYGVYFGTASLLETQVCETADDAWIVHCQGRSPDVPKPKWQRNDECPHHPGRVVEAWVFSDYGNPDHWPVLICKACMSVVAGWSGYGGEYGYDGPRLDEQYRDWLLMAGGYPKSGPPPNVTVVHAESAQ